MKNAVFTFPVPANEPVKSYLKGSPERVALEETEQHRTGYSPDYRRQGSAYRQHR